jgi:hypothetical protein
MLLSFTVRLPQAESAEKRVRIVTRPAARRQHFEPVDISSTDDHIVRQKRRCEPGNDIRDVSPPLSYARRYQSVNPDIILKGSVLIG